MAYKLIATPTTDNDIDDAVQWYLGIRKDLARQFLSELKAVRKYILKNPKKIQIRYGNIRVAFLKKFPYGVHYEFKNDTITIVAVFSTADDPTRWKGRSKQ